MWPDSSGSILSVGINQLFSTIQSAVKFALTKAQFSSTALAGTVSVSLDGRIVTGVGTNFLTALSTRKYISFGTTNKYYAIKSIASDTTLRLISAFKETTISGGTAVSGQPIMNVIRINDNISEDVYINTTGAVGGGQLDNIAISINWVDGAQYSGTIEHYSRSGVLQINGLRQVDVAPARVLGKVASTDLWSMMDLFFNNIYRRDIAEVDFILNRNTQRTILKNSFIEGSFDLFMPFCSGEVYIQNSTLRSFPGDEADTLLLNQSVASLLTANDASFTADNSRFVAGCYGASPTYVVQLAAKTLVGSMKSGCTFTFNNCELVAEKVPGSTEVVTFAFVDVEANNATINFNNTPFIYIGNPTPGATWKNFTSEPTVSVASQINVKGHGIMQGLGSDTAFNTINVVDNNAVQTVAYAAAITPNANFGNRVNVGALTGAMTVNAPVNPQSGQYLDFAFLQDATGGRLLTWDAVFKKAADGAGAANQRGTIRFRYDGTNWIQQGGALTYFT